MQILWQAQPGEQPRPARVRYPDNLEQGPSRLTITAAVSDREDLRGQAAYIQLNVPDVGPVLAWVGIPGGRQRDGRFVHPMSGRTWAWGELHEAVRFAISEADRITATN